MIQDSWVFIRWILLERSLYPPNITSEPIEGNNAVWQAPKELILIYFNRIIPAKDLKDRSDIMVLYGNRVTWKGIITENIIILMHL